MLFFFFEPDFSLKMEHLPTILRGIIKHAGFHPMGEIESSQFRVLNEIAEELYEMDLRN